MPKKKNQNNNAGGGLKGTLRDLGYSKEQVNAVKRSLKGLPPQLKQLERSRMIQDALNLQQQQQFNQFSEQGPFGTKTYTTDAEGRTQVNYNISPEEQARLDAQRARDAQLQQMAMGSLGQAQQAMSQPFDISSLNIPQMPSQDQFAALKNQTTEELYNTYSAPLTQKHNREMADFEKVMANRGIPATSQQYASQFKLLRDQQASELNQARTQAIQIADQTASGSFQRQLANRQNAITEQLTQRGLPLQEAQSMAASIAGPQLPQFSQTTPLSVPGSGVAGTAIPLAEIQSRENIARMAAANSGGGPSYNPYGPEALNYNLSLINARANADVYAQQQAAALGQQNRPNPWGQLGGAVAGGIGSSLGQSIIGGLF